MGTSGLLMRSRPFYKYFESSKNKDYLLLNQYSVMWTPFYSNKWKYISNILKQIVIRDVILSNMMWISFI